MNPTIGHLLHPLINPFFQVMHLPESCEILVRKRQPWPKQLWPKSTSSHPSSCKIFALKKIRTFILKSTYFQTGAILSIFFSKKLAIDKKVGNFHILSRERRWAGTWHMQWIPNRVYHQVLPFKYRSIAKRILTYIRASIRQLLASQQSNRQG